jgi:hypothetical protein
MEHIVGDLPQWQQTIQKGGDKKMKQATSFTVAKHSHHLKVVSSPPRH